MKEARTITILKDPDISCPCVTVHRPALVEVHEHHIVPLYAGGRATGTNVIRVCTNTHYATHALIREYERNKGTPPWSVRRQFPEFARELARRGWEERTDKGRAIKEPKR